MSLATVLIVDDQEDNIAVLYTFLEENTDYSLLVATNGQSALDIVKEKKPDIVLLDIMMPGINGYEICRRMKEEETTKDIPVIFMTALSDTKNILEGFAAGAVDYITKPFQQEEILVRIRTHLKISQLQNDLQKKNEELKAFSHTVAHDLKNPLNSIVILTDIAIENCEEGISPDSNIGDLKKIKEITFKANSIIDALLLLADSSRVNDLKSESFNMTSVISVVMDGMSEVIKKYQGSIKTPEEWPDVIGYAPWVEEVWINYISNAIKYGGRPPEVKIGYDLFPDHVKFWVKDNGPGLSDDQMKNLFIPFSRLDKQKAEGHGLGLSIVSHIMNKLGGQTGAECKKDEGCLFYFTLQRVR